MNVFVTGSRGFIGRRLAAQLAAAGHRVLCGVSPRRGDAPDACPRMVVDFTRDVDIDTWLPRLCDVDCIINTVGVIASARDIAAIHTAAPKALFAAAAQRGVEVIQISALGADERAVTSFHCTKRAADDALLAAHPLATVVQPSLVFGEDGTSARMFMTIASLPLIPLPAGGNQRVQPIHVDDLVAAVAALVGNRRFAGRRLALVGPEPLALRDFLAQLRSDLHLGRARFLSIPRPIASLAASVAGALRSTLVNRETWQMLERGNTADVAVTRELLGRLPRRVTQFVAPERSALLARNAKLAWLLGLLRFAIAVVWLVAGVVSAGIYPVADSLALIAHMGVTGVAASVLLYAGVAVDLVLGIATLLVRNRRLWLLEIAVVLGYTIMISIWLPEFWAHPYGPLAKNIPVLCALYMLYELEER